MQIKGEGAKDEMKVKELIELNGCYAQMEICSKGMNMSVDVEALNETWEGYKELLEKEIEYIDCDFHSLLIVI